jgi:hypothetical protein
LTWPARDLADYEIDLGATALALPVRRIPVEEAAMPIAETHLAFGRGEPSLEIRETAAGRVEVKGAWPPSRSKVAGVGVTLAGSGPDMDLEIVAGAPESSRWTVRQTSAFQREGWDCALRVEISMTSTAEAFLIEERLEALESGTVVFSTNRSGRAARLA